MLNQHTGSAFFIFWRLIMKKILRFSFLVSLFEKIALERLAEVNGESQASFLRRLIRQAAEQHGISKPIESALETKFPVQAEAKNADWPK